MIEGATSGKVGFWLSFSFCGGSEGDRNKEAVGATVGHRDVPTDDIAGSEVGAAVGAKLAYNNGAFEGPEIAGGVVGVTVGKGAGSCKLAEDGRYVGFIVGGAVANGVATVAGG